MINSLEAYAECGHKAGVARNEGDESRAAFHTAHYRKMRALENSSDKELARRACDEAYARARNVPKPAHWR